MLTLCPCTKSQNNHFFLHGQSQKAILYKHMHQLQNPLISVTFCHKSYNSTASLTVIIVKQEAEVHD